MDRLVILNANNQSMGVSVVRYFGDGSNNYFVFSLNEVDNQGRMNIYVTKVVNQGGVIVGTNIVDDVEWSNVKLTLQKIIKDNKSSGSAFVPDLPVTELENIRVLDRRALKLLANSVDMLNMGYKFNSAVTEEHAADPVQLRPIVDETPVQAEEPIVVPVQEEQPVVATPVYEQPVPAAPVAYEQPVPAAPVAYEQPVPAAPVAYEQSVPAAPVYEQPVAAAPVVSEQPVPAAPVVSEQPVPAAPVAYEQPVPAAPVYEQPVAAAPVVSEQPVPAAPVYEQPVAAAPVYEQPVPAAPVYEQPVAAAPVYEQPVSAAPVYEQPVPVQYGEEPVGQVPGNSDFEQLFLAEKEKNDKLLEENNLLLNELNNYKLMISDVKDILSR